MNFSEINDVLTGKTKFDEKQFDEMLKDSFEYDGEKYYPADKNSHDYFYRLNPEKKIISGFSGSRSQYDLDENGNFVDKRIADYEKQKGVKIKGINEFGYFIDENGNPIIKDNYGSKLKFSDNIIARNDKYNEIKNALKNKDFLQKVNESKYNMKNEKNEIYGNTFFLGLGFGSFNSIDSIANKNMGDFPNELSGVDSEKAFYTLDESGKYINSFDYKSNSKFYSAKVDESGKIYSIEKMSRKDFETKTKKFFDLVDEKIKSEYVKNSIFQGKFENFEKTFEGLAMRTISLSELAYQLKRSWNLNLDIVSNKTLGSGNSMGFVSPNYNGKRSFEVKKIFADLDNQTFSDTVKIDTLIHESLHALSHKTIMNLFSEKGDLFDTTKSGIFDRSKIVAMEFFNVAGTAYIINQMKKINPGIKSSYYGYSNLIPHILETFKQSKFFKDKGIQTFEDFGKYYLEQILQGGGFDEKVFLGKDKISEIDLSMTLQKSESSYHSDRYSHLLDFHSKNEDFFKVNSGENFFKMYDLFLGDYDKKSREYKLFSANKWRIKTQFYKYLKTQNFYDLDLSRTNLPNLQYMQHFITQMQNVLSQTGGNL